MTESGFYPRKRSLKITSSDLMDEIDDASPICAISFTERETEGAF
jgi:hypothetical protein